MGLFDKLKSLVSDDKKDTELLRSLLRSLARSSISKTLPDVVLRKNRW